MSGVLLPRLRKSWSLLRRRLSGAAAGPERLVIAKTKWLNDLSSPVMLMVDDLTNAWHSPKKAATWELGGDWGGGFRKPKSSMGFLEDRLMREFPEARVTFFTVAGPISPYTHHEPFSFAAPLDATPESAAFFKSVAVDPRYELAYHGLNHGTPGVRYQEFVQEWRGFSSVAEANEQTQKGLSIFERAVGARPAGGKFGGYDYNEFAQDSLDECGFLWWCRDWMPRDVGGRVPDDYYEPQFFGRNMLVALPSTVHGYHWDPRQIEVLLAKRQIISIAEHIAPVRPTGVTQTPNIIDDMAELRRLYAFLRGCPVWHATGTQIASYVTARERTHVYDVTADGFSLRYDGRVERPVLTLRIDRAATAGESRPFLEITPPDGGTALVVKQSAETSRPYFLATIPVMNGRYTVKFLANSDANAA